MSHEAVDRWMSRRMGVELASCPPAHLTVVAAERCTRREPGYGFVRLFWLLDRVDHAVLAVHPRAADEIAGLLAGRAWHEALWPETLAECAEVLARSLGLDAVPTPAWSQVACHLGGAPMADDQFRVEPLRLGEIPPWPGQRRYQPAANHPSAARGEAYALWVGDQSVAEVITHDQAVEGLEPLVVEDGIEVAEAWRGQGYGRALLSYWTARMQELGRVCVHSTSPANTASIRLGRSAGYLPYARTVSFTRHQDE